MLHKTHLSLWNIAHFATSLTKGSITEKYIALVILCKCDVLSFALIQGKMFSNINGPDEKKLYKIYKIAWPKEQRSRNEMQPHNATGQHCEVTTQTSAVLQQDLYFYVCSWGQQVVCRLHWHNFKLENPEVWVQYIISL